MTDLLVLHDVGASGGGEWADGFTEWPGAVFAPDLPGHHGTPPPVGGNYDTGDAVVVALDVLRDVAHGDLLVVGIGHSGAAAQVLALGGRAAGLVLVDGLGGPWLEPGDVDAQRRALRRRVLSTPTALAMPDADTDDPRASMVVGVVDRAFAVQQAVAMPVPVLVVETPSSPTPDAPDMVACFGDATLQQLVARQPSHVAQLVASWWSSRKPA
ncbi:MAG: hypothetical protein AAGA42_00275 [Actinomycetota bacterium]